MRAGRLRNEATIQQTTPTRSSSGAAVDAWTSFVASWWCELVQVSGGEAFRGRQVHANADSVAIGRYASGVTPQMRLTHGGKTYQILAVNDVEKRERELRLELREVGV